MQAPSLSFLIFLLFVSIQTVHAQLIINEIYADVAVSLSGDANGDGIRNAREDEFIELFNNYDVPLDISHYFIEISDELKHEFSGSTILPPKSFIVVFGGGLPTGIFGGSQVVLASKNGLSLGNVGSKVVLKNKEGITLDMFTYTSQNVDASWVRNPDITGDFMPHDEVSAAFKQPFSPGTLNNSFPFNNGDTTLVHFVKTSGTILERAPEIELLLNLTNPKNKEITVIIELIGGIGSSEDLAGFTSQTVVFPVNSISQRKVTIPIFNDMIIEGNETFIIGITSISDPKSSKISINQNFELTIYDDDFDLGIELIEILADPPTGIEGDANQDGTRDAKQDEFIEFMNITDQTIDLSGMGIYDSEALRHQIPDSTIINPNQIFLVFGGGKPPKPFGEAITQLSSTKDLSLANSGDQIIIRDTNKNVVFFYEYGSEGGNNQSIIFCPNLGDKDGPKTLHSSTSLGLLFSPGKANSCEQIGTTSIHEQYDALIKVYPNPAQARSRFYIELTSELTLEKISLVDISGKTILVSRTTGWIILPFNSLLKGMYFLKIKTNKGLFVKKIIFD